MLQKDIFRITPRLYIEKSVPSAKARCGGCCPADCFNVYLAGAASLTMAKAFKVFGKPI